MWQEGPCASHSIGHILCAISDVHGLTYIPDSQFRESDTSVTSVNLSHLHWQPATCLGLGRLLTLVHCLEMLHHRMWDVTSWVPLKGPYDVSQKYRGIKFSG